MADRINYIEARKWEKIGVMKKIVYVGGGGGGGMRTSGGGNDGESKENIQIEENYYGQ